MRQPPAKSLRCLALFLAQGLIAAAAGEEIHVFSVADFGATGSDIRGDTAAIQRAIDACAGHGGGQVVVPSGATLTIGTIELKSRVELHLERGALLQGSPHHGDFTRFALPPTWFEPGPVQKLGVVVYADNAEDIAITGPGRIDGNGMAYVSEVGPYIYKCVSLRPFTVVLKDCRHVLLRDFSLTNSAFWTLRLLGCDDATIDSVRIDGDLRMPNNDGIDIDRSSNVRVHGCHITTGDDCISLKAVPLSEGITRPCENVVISGCTLVSRSSGIVLGCDVSGAIRDVVVSDCVITDSHRGVAVRLSLEGTIERALFSNLVIETKIFDSMWWGRGEPIQIEAVPWNERTRLGVIRDIRFSNLICRSENGAVVYAAEPGHIENISFDRVSIRIDRPSAFAGGQQDLRPTATAPLPQMGTSGFLLRHAAGVSFRDCSIAWGPDPPAYFQYALDADGCPGLAASGLAGEAAHPGTEARSVR
ncbi:MAG TPA: glycosyl hydrolase family 28 protein [Opitutaceae bacterium]|nr:glycosyl hydrolase family 28 protein [Opitutaceae bacterium]